MPYATNGLSFSNLLWALAAWKRERHPGELFLQSACQLVREGGYGGRRAEQFAHYWWGLWLMCRGACGLTLLAVDHEALPVSLSRYPPPSL